tara:strand:- start:5484 stop:8111 length:2628 start_codon:yes stop_codon:yes gene_type:complete
MISMSLLFWRKSKKSSFQPVVIDLTIGASLADDYFLPESIKMALKKRNLRLDVTVEKAENLIEEWDDEFSILNIRSAYNSKDWPMVFALCEARMNVFEEIEVHIHLIRAYYSGNDWSNCMKICNSLLTFSEGNIEAYRFLARCSKNKSEIDLASEFYLKVLEISASDTDALQSLIRIRYNQNEHDRVIALSKQLIDENPQIRDGHLFNARSEMVLGNHEAAVEPLTVLLEIDSQDLEALVSIGKVLHNLERYESAMLYLERALDIDPEERRSRRTLAMIYDRLGMPVKALKLYDKECIFEPMMFSNWEKKINLLYRINRQDEARESIPQLLELEKHTLDAYLLANEIALSFYWNEISSTLLEHCTNTWSHQEDYYFKIAMITYKSGELTKTWHYIEKGLEMNSNDTNLLLLKEDLLSLLKETNTPKQLLTEAVKNSIPLLKVECYIMHLIETASKVPRYSPTESNCNVIMVSSSLGRGGAERQVVSCLGGLMREKQFQDTVLFCYSLSGSRGHKQTYEAEVRATGVDIKEYGSRNNWNSEFEDADALLAPWKKYLDRLPVSMQREIEPLFLNFTLKKPKIVHGWQDQTNINVSIAGLMSGVPGIVMFARSMRPDGKTMMHIRNRPYLRRAYETLIDSSNRPLLCHNSIAGCQSYGEWLNHHFENFEVIHNGVDFDGLERSSAGTSMSDVLEIPKDSFVIGGVFRLVIEKRPRLWVESIAKVIRKRDNVHAIHVGGGGLSELIQSHIIEQGVKDNIHLISQTTQVKAWLDEFDVFLLTSIVEGLPNVLIEAQAFGVPVISTDAGGSRDTFIDGETGYLVDEPNSDQIAELILTCIDNPEWMADARKKSREQARERFSQEAMVERLKEIYSIAVQRM